MNLLGLLENGLFALGQVLRFPVMALLWICVLAVLFNLIADLVGGVRVTVLEEEVVLRERPVTAAPPRQRG